MAFWAEIWGNLPKNSFWKGCFTHLRAPHIAALLFLLSPLAAGAAAPVVDDLTTNPVLVLPGETVDLQVDAHDPDCPDSCTTGCGQVIRADLTFWSADGGSFVEELDGTTGSPYTATATWQAPAAEATYTVEVFLADSGSFICGGRQTITATIDILVTNNPNLPPVVETLTALPPRLLPGGSAALLCVASDPEEDPVTYDWAADLGTVTSGTGGTATYTAPATVLGIDTITCTASDGVSAGDGSDTVQIAIVGAEGEKALVRDLVAPQRLGADSEGNLFVVDQRSGGITVINLFSEELVYRIPLPDATAIAVDWNDNLLVGGRYGADLRVRRGDVVLSLDQGGSPGDVSDVAVDPVNRRYGVLYRGSGQVAVFDELGAPVLSFGSTGDDPDQFKSPQGLAAAPAGDWLVADSGHGQIKRFDADGTLVASFGAPGGGLGEFVQLDDVAVDANGIIYASDSFQSWVQVFDPDGTLRESLGGHGQELGELKTPTGIVEVADVSGLGDFDRLVVASLNSSSLQVFRRDKDPLVGPPPSAEAAVTPPALDFADTAVGQISAGFTASLSNVGSAILGVLGVTASAPFAAAHSCLALEPGESCSIAVTFEPQAAGPQVGALDIETSSGPLAVALVGQAFLPADVELKPAGLGFSDQEIGTISDPQPVTLTNTGSVALEILSIGASAEYLVSHDCPSTLAAAAGCTLQVRYAAESVVDIRSGTITVISSAVGSPHTVSLAGRGVPVVPRFSIRALEPAGVEEGDGSPVVARFEVTLDAAATGPTSVNYRVGNGTADAGEDFEPAAGLLEFPAGETSQIISVSIVGDEILEPDFETLPVELWGSLAAAIEDGSAETSVLDDEVCLGPVLLANAGAEVLDGESPIPAWSESPGADWAIRSLSPEPYEGIAYFAAGPTEFTELMQEVDVSEFAEAIDAGRQLLDFSARVRTAQDDTARILIEYRNWDKSVVLDRFDSREISSAAGWQEITDLRAAPPDTRWLQVRLLGSRRTGTENDVFFDALSLRTIRAATVDVADFSAYEGSDGVASAILSVKLACPYFEDVFVDLATTDGTATAGEDYQATVTTVLLPTGETEDQVVVDLFGDLYDEGHEEFFVDVDGIEPAGAVQLTERAAGVILDDDFCPMRASVWAANADLLPPRLALGGIVYERPELIGFLLSNSNDVWLDVARELTAARLNLRMGSHPYILPTAAAADAYLATYAPGGGSDGDGWQTGINLSNELKLYNHRRACSLGPPVPGAGPSSGPGG